MIAKYPLTLTPQNNTHTHTRNTKYWTSNQFYETKSMGIIFLKFEFHYRSHMPNIELSKFPTTILSYDTYIQTHVHKCLLFFFISNQIRSSYRHNLYYCGEKSKWCDQILNFGFIGSRASCVVTQWPMINYDTSIDLFSCLVNLFDIYIHWHKHTHTRTHFI